MLNAQTIILSMMVAISVVVWWQWMRRRRAYGQLWPGEPEEWGAPNSAAFAVAVAFSLLHFWTALHPVAEPNPTQISLTAVQAGCGERLLLIAILVPLLLGFRGGDPRGWGLTTRDWHRQMLDGLEVAHASFLPVLGIMLVTMPLRSEEKMNPLLRLLAQDRSLQTLGWILLAAVVLAPLLEELLFRVIVLGWFRGRLGSAHAIGISSLVFAAIHGPLDGAALLPLAFLLGRLFDRRHQFLSVFVAHATFNLWNIVLTMAAR
jgi:membrane protease YdiL (CAAX protease family)